MANILIVEDDCDIAEGLAELLFAAGHQTRTAANGVEGLRRIAEHAPDLVLLDAEMPILDGAGMARALAAQRAGRPPIPIVVVSASLDIRGVAGRIGTPHFVGKPFRLEQLIDVVDAALASNVAPEG